MSFPHGPSGSFSGHPALMFCNFCFGLVATTATGAPMVAVVELRAERSYLERW